MKKEENLEVQVNKLLDYFNNYQDNNVTKESIITTREELFTRLFGKKEIVSINSNLEAVLPNNKKTKLKEYDKLEDIIEILDSSKDAYTFLLYSKNKKDGHILDIIGFIILTLIAIGFIYANHFIIGLIFAICYMSLYYVTFKKR